MNRFLVLAPVFLAATLGLAACTSGVGVSSSGTPSDAGEPPASFAQFSDLPFPAKSDLDLERTLIFGGGESWFGRVLVTTSASPNEAYDFYKDRMGGLGWQEITSLRSAVSILTFSRDQRVATVQIQKRTIRGSEVAITVSPRGSGSGPTGSGLSGGTAAPLPPVQRGR